MERQTVRFWVWWNDGLVKLDIRDGQRIELYRHRNHEEGWASESIEVERDGDFLTMVQCTDGTDCDGRVSSVTEWEAEAGATRTRYNGNDWTHFTDLAWERVRASQRDYFAEAMGY